MFARMTRDRYLSDDELTAVMSAVGLRRHKNQPRDHAFFALIANVGIRPSEAMRLVRGDIHLDGKAPWIRVDRQHPKHAPQPVTELVLNRDVARVLRTYIRNIPASDRSVKPFPFTKRQAERLFHYYAPARSDAGQHHRHLAGRARQ